MNCTHAPSDPAAWAATGLELLRRTSTELPDDITAALQRAADDAREDSAATAILRTLIENAGLARTAPSPICQDTGTLTCWIGIPPADPSPTRRTPRRGCREHAPRLPAPQHDRDAQRHLVRRQSGGGRAGNACRDGSRHR